VEASSVDHVIIKIDEIGKGSVAINGHELHSTAGVTLEANAGELTIMTIRVIAVVEIEAEIRHANILKESTHAQLA
jgi:hypothetical protein